MGSMKRSGREENPEYFQMVQRILHTTHAVQPIEKKNSISTRSKKSSLSICWCRTFSPFTLTSSKLDEAIVDQKMLHKKINRNVVATIRFAKQNKAERFVWELRNTLLQFDRAKRNETDEFECATASRSLISISSHRKLYLPLHLHCTTTFCSSLSLFYATTRLALQATNTHPKSRGRYESADPMHHRSLEPTL